MTIKELRKLLEDLVPLIGEDSEICGEDENGDPYTFSSDMWLATKGKLVLR